jgi:acetyltransferase-like isoleucine patch superfamily enzyme
MRSLIKNILNRFCQLLVLPIAATCWIEKKLSEESEVVFSFWAQAISLVPGIPGSFVRRAFYSLTLEKCSLNSHIGFGSIFTHRNVIVDDSVYIGLYCVIGSSHLCHGTLIASRVSIPSGKKQHIWSSDKGWVTFDKSRMVRVRIGPRVWVGEGACVMANVGEGSLVAAGAVVTKEVSAGSLMAGNPARFVRRSHQ